MASRQLSEGSMKRLVTETATIRPEILRRTSLSSTLGDFGRLWRVSPVDLIDESRGKLWNLSEPCEELDWFISHSWRTPGWLKFMTLLFLSQWLPALLIMCSIAAMLIALDVQEMLPSVTVRGIAICPWATVPPMIGLLSTLARPSRGPTVFFDATCINQVDDELKQEGVYSLAGFLAHSKRLLVLWSPTYFNRVWCVYELAMFAVLQETNRITFRPPFLYCLYFAIFMCFTINSTMGFLAVVLFAEPWQLLCCKFVLMFPAAWVAIHLLRPHLWCLQQLPTQMERFDVKDAESRDSWDRDTVLYFITRWYGSTENFNAYVRGPLKDLVCSVHLCFPYKTILIMMTPRFCYTAMWIVVQARAGMPSSQLAAFATGAVLNDIFFYASSLKCMLLLINCFAAPRANKVADLAVSMCLALCRAIYVTSVEGLSLIEVVDNSLPNHQANFILAYSIAGVVIAAVTFRSDLRGCFAVPEAQDGAEVDAEAEDVETAGTRSPCDCDTDMQGVGSCDISDEIDCEQGSQRAGRDSRIYSAVI